MSIAGVPEVVAIPELGEGVLRCPCGSEYLKHGTVEVWGRYEEDGGGASIFVDPTVGEATVRHAEAGFIGRRGDIRIHFVCEQCEWARTLVLYQHKGQTLLYWSDSADGSKAPWE